jgi:two-component system nitrogen regulation sensor histidine kinase GlnL
MTKISQAPIQAIIDNLHSAVIVVNQDLCVEYLNPSAEMLLQISHTRAMGRKVKELINQGQEFFARIEDSLITHHPFSMYEIELTTQTGQVQVMDFMASPIEYRDTGKYLLLEFVSRGRLYKLVQKENLLNQNEASRSLLRGLAHEIKNPLGGLRGAAQLLERELESEKDREFTDIIIREADRLKSLVDKMLGPSSTPDVTRLNIHKVLEHVRQLVQVENNTIKFVVDYDPSLPDLDGDESMLIQAILNITRNAAREVSPDGQIIFRTRPLRNYTIGHTAYPLVAKIDVIDNGPGIPEDLKEKIFLPMVTGRADGTGLGLSIAQTLINQHNGLIECSSTPDETIFTLLLPLQHEAVTHDNKK